MAALTTEERLSRLEGVYEHLATKDDLATLRGELKADVAALRGELKADMADLKGELTSEIRAMEVRLIKWMVGGMAVWAAVLIGGMRLLGS
ncbi:MAG: hypothetical protein OXE05_00680 [Chloroflexi bacterium]|nr:hypothetical protein [Chloroflexota bacterium]